MKFMQIHSFYSAYLNEYYTKNKSIATASYHKQIASLIADGFSGSHMLAPYMPSLGYESLLVIANCIQLQQQWLQEFKPEALATATDAIYEVTRMQIEQFKPDILYLTDPITFDSSFVKSLSFRPALVFGWRAASIPPGIDWTEFDLMLSNFDVSLNMATKFGARDVQFFLPGFPASISQRLETESKQYDVVFSGQVSGEHGKRRQILNMVSQTLLQKTDPFTLAYFIPGSSELDAGIMNYNHGAVWGMDMFRALRQGRIVLNVQIDMGGNQAGNMRLFESTGVGSFMLTDFHPNINRYFKPGVEIETYRNTDELKEKIYYYLAHPEQREAIARRGQERCLRDYSMEQSARELDLIIKSKLSSASANILQKPDQVASPQEDLYDTAYRWGWDHPELRRLVYLCYKTPDLADNARRFSMSDGFKEVVSLLIDMGKAPGKESKVLDLGCGNGVALYALSRLGYTVTGLDSSLGELAGLNAAAKLNGLDGAHFTLLHSTGEFLDFPDESFDVIWMREVLHHIHDLKGFMKEAARILKPDGIICCLREHVIWNEGQREHFFRTHPFYHITKDEGCYYLEEYLAAFSKANLAIEKVFSPVDSVINTYPTPWQPGLFFNPEAARQRPEGNDLFSFFARKPAVPVAQEISDKPLDTGNSVLLDSFAIQVRDILEGQTYFKSGNDCMIGAQLQLISPEAQISIGDRVYISPGTRFICCDRIEFGSDILVAWGCTFIDHDSFPMDADTRKAVVRDKVERLRRGEQDWDKPELTNIARGKITIEDNAWIGMNCTILKGVTIGEGAVVGACSVVTEDVEPWTVVIGNPARRII